MAENFNDVYTCSICGGRYERGHLKCLVFHEPGQCCHLYDKPLGHSNVHSHYGPAPTSREMKLFKNGKDK